MKKIMGLALSCGLITGLVLTTSCEDDPPIKPKISFAESSITFKESDGVIEIEVTLDRPALDDFTIDYELDGTAQDEETASQNTDFPDYVVVEDNNNYGEVDIEKGATSGIIEIELYSDFQFEDSETIDIEIVAIDSENAEITNDDDVKISIEQEDGLVILLDWEYTNVDMDLFLWATDGGTLGITNLGSASASMQGPEFIFIHNGIDDGQYGVSCTYYSGPDNLDPMNFTVDFITIVNGDDASTVSRSGAYKPANRNAWDTSNGTDPLLAVTYTKSGSSYTNISQLAVQSTGSRTSNSFSKYNLKKGIKGGVVLKRKPD